jgi:hypothetical protein
VHSSFKVRGNTQSAVLLITPASAANTASRLCGACRNRMAMAQCLCDQTPWCRRVSQAHGGTLRSRRVHCKLEQGMNDLQSDSHRTLVSRGNIQYADPVLDKLDIHKVVSHRLFRESCYLHKGNYVKVSTLHHCCNAYLSFGTGFESAWATNRGNHHTGQLASVVHIPSQQCSSCVLLVQ